MASKNWRLRIDLKFGGEEWSFDLTSGEQGLLTLMRASYPMIEQKLREAAKSPPGSLPFGLLDDGLALFRCLVLNRLEQYAGPHVTISQV